MFTKIWERYFVKEVLKTLFFFLICFYGLYAFIDTANHSRSFQDTQGHFYWKAFCLYYGCEFINRSEILIPFALLLGTIRTLCKLNTNNELIAMMTSGVKLSRLLRPFLLLGLLFTALMYLNLEYALPAAFREMKYLENAHGKEKKHKKHHSSAFSAEHVILEDHSTLLFQNYDPVKELIFDAYWVRSIDDIYKIKYLHINPSVAYFVDHLERNDQDELVIVDSETVMELPELKFDPKSIADTFLQPENLSLTQLWEQLPENREAHSEKEARLVAAFHRKLALPWLCLLAVIACAPICIGFSRQFPVFLVYAGSLFGLIAIYIVIDAAHVLGRRQFMDPLYALWTPFVLFFLIFGWRYVRIQ